MDERASGTLPLHRRCALWSAGYSVAFQWSHSLRLLLSWPQPLLQLSHPNIVRLYEVYESQSDLFLVMEYCSGGELFDRIKDAGAFSEKQAASILRQMCEGLKYMSVETGTARRGAGLSMSGAG